jgi:hypothetical protein
MELNEIQLFTASNENLTDYGKEGLELMQRIYLEKYRDQKFE